VPFKQTFSKVPLANTVHPRKHERLQFANDLAMTNVISTQVSW